LPPNEVAANKHFENITQAWLYGDHYKWRALRTNGINEKYITGDASDEEKFEKWAETVPYTLRNPLYHWTHLELQRYFDVNELLRNDNAPSIDTHSSDRWRQPGIGVHGLLEKMNAHVICTTDDPLDTLEHRQQ